MLIRHLDNLWASFKIGQQPADQLRRQGFAPFSGVTFCLQASVSMAKMLVFA